MRVGVQALEQGQGGARRTQRAALPGDRRLDGPEHIERSGLGRYGDEASRGVAVRHHQMQGAQTAGHLARRKASVRERAPIGREGLVADAVRRPAGVRGRGGGGGRARSSRRPPRPVSV
ncbi:hypothetical protein GCM10015535_17200 [Streptomyces gelaticus]|uniref:Uncharacterized protein n=1 Tax=Streptomyces gelaticus TaxID=285446 RepID=A0ABQ2VVE1_9ACTN|nr:hypothetical protein GCM10015535_17200 [Streptomyces gelaticus]